MSPHLAARRRLTEPPTQPKTCVHCGAWPAPRKTTMGRVCDDCWKKVKP